MSTDLKQIVQLLATSAVTVMGSYLSITAHIDNAVANKVHEAVLPIDRRISSAWWYADSLHRVQAMEIEQLRQPVRRNR